MQVDDIVDPSEMLLAMSSSLMEKQPKPFNPSYSFQDSVAPGLLKIGGRPPREVFYRKTVTFMTKIPARVPSKVCSCKYVCEGSEATIICHSCSIYDINHAYYYCQSCFNARHPWYRLPHVFTDIENDESIQHTLKVAHRVSEVSRYELEGKNMLSNLREEERRLRYIADDELVDNSLREYGRKAVALEEHISSLRLTLKHDLEREAKKSFHSAAAAPPMESRQVLATKKAPNHPTGIPESVHGPKHSHISSRGSFMSDITADDHVSLAPNAQPVDGRSQWSTLSRSSATSSAVSIQRLFKGYLARRIVSNMVSLRVVRVFDKDLGRDYFFDTVTGESSWSQPKLLLARHLDSLQYVEDNCSPPRLWCCKNSCRRRRDQPVADRSVACSVLKGFGRCVLARYCLLRRANIVFRRVLDSETGAFYYVDTRSGQSSWSKSRIYLNTMDPPIHRNVDDPVVKIQQSYSNNSNVVSSNSNNNNSKQRIHPLTNRDRVR